MPLAHKPRGRGVQHAGVASEPAEAVPGRLPCKRAEVPEGVLEVVYFQTVVEPCKILKINLFPSLSCDTLICGLC